MKRGDDPVLRSLMDSFRRIVGALRSSHRAAGQFRLTGAQLYILKVLGEADGPIGMNDLAEATQTTQGTASVVTGRLVDRGLVTSERSTADGRRVGLTLTPRGRVVHRKTPATVAQVKLAAALKKLSSRDAAELSDLLATIVLAMGIGGEPARMMFEDEQSPSRRRSKPASVRGRRAG